MSLSSPLSPHRLPEGGARSGLASKHASPCIHLSVCQQRARKLRKLHPAHDRETQGNEITEQGRLMCVWGPLDWVLLSTSMVIWPLVTAPLCSDVAEQLPLSRGVKRVEKALASPPSCEQSHYHDPQPHSADLPLNMGASFHTPRPPMDVYWPREHSSRKSGTPAKMSVRK